jgi:hypothetical protein
MSSKRLKFVGSDFSRLNAFCKNPTKTGTQGGLNVDEIMRELRARKLDATGKRDELVKRLCDNLLVSPVTKSKLVPAIGATPKVKVTKPKQKSESKPKVKVTKPKVKPKQKSDPKITVTPTPPASEGTPKQKSDPKTLDRLIYLFYTLDQPGREEEFDKLSVSWYKSLSTAEHRDKTWIQTHPEHWIVNDIYTIAQKAIVKLETGVSVATDSLTEDKEQLKLILRFSHKRRLLYLEGPILDTLSALVKEKLEHGGMIDINKAGIFDRAVFGIGEAASVNVGDVIDYEIVFHTHPVGRTNFMFEPPSQGDGRVSTISRLQQVHVVFTPEAVYTVYAPKPEYPQAVRDALEAINVNNLQGGTRTYSGMIQYIEEFAAHGVYIFRYSNFKRLSDLLPEPKLNWPKRIPLFIDPQEPVINLTRRGVRFTEEQNALTAALRAQAKQRRA